MNHPAFVRLFETTCKNRLKNEKHHLITLQNHLCRGGSISIPYINQPKVVPFCNNDSQQLKLGVHGSGEHLALVHLETDGKKRSMCKWMQMFKQNTLPLSFQIPFCCKCGVRISKDFSSLDFFAFCFIWFNAVLSNVDPLMSRIPRQHFLSFRQHEMTSWNCYSVTFPRWDAICHCFCICFHFSACHSLAVESTAWSWDDQFVTCREHTICAVRPTKLIGATMFVDFASADHAACHTLSQGTWLLNSNPSSWGMSELSGRGDLWWFQRRFQSRETQRTDSSLSVTTSK